MKERINGLRDKDRLDQIYYIWTEALLKDYIPCKRPKEIPFTKAIKNILPKETLELVISLVVTLLYRPSIAIGDSKEFGLWITLGT